MEANVRRAEKYILRALVRLNVASTRRVAATPKSRFGFGDRDFPLYLAVRRLSVNNENSRDLSMDAFPSLSFIRRK